MIFTINNIPTASINVLNKGNYNGNAYGGYSYWPTILIIIAVFVALCITFYFLNKKFNLTRYLKEFFRDDCAFCRKPLEKKEGIRKTMNWEGTMMMRKMAFCNDNHMHEYTKKWGEPIGCACSMKFEKYSFEWWIQFIRIAIFFVFFIFILIIMLMKNL